MPRKNNVALDELNEMLYSETLSVFERNRIKEFLEWAATMPKRSARNQLVIHQQMPDGTMFLGYSEWEKLGRYVLKGQKGVVVFSPILRRKKVEKTDANGNVIYGSDGNPVIEVRTWIDGFKKGYVFDISQTGGKPVPSVTTLLRGKVDGMQEATEALSAISPATIVFDEEGCGAGYNAEKNIINLSLKWSEQKMMQTLLPSVAAALMTKSLGRTVEYDDLEAESAAYVIAKHLGIDADYDFDYVTDWKEGKDAEELTATLSAVRDTAKDVIDSFKETIRINKARSKEVKP